MGKPTEVLGWICLLGTNFFMGTSHIANSEFMIINGSADSGIYS